MENNGRKNYKLLRNINLIIVEGIVNRSTSHNQSLRWLKQTRDQFFTNKKEKDNPSHLNIRGYFILQLHLNIF